MQKNEYKLKERKISLNEEYEVMIWDIEMTFILLKI